MPPLLEETTNRLLGALRPDDLGRLGPHLKLVALEQNRVLCEAGEPIQRVFFPTSSVISLLVVAREGGVVEGATIGNEGIAGLGGLLCDDVSYSRQLVLLPGRAVAVDRQPFLDALRRVPRLRSLLTSHTDALIAQTLQNVACTALHSAAARMARLLLSCLDRGQDGDLAMTQDLLASMLGVRRPTVTLAACALRAAGFINYRRGVVTVRDPKGLSAAACECYSVIKSNYAGVLTRHCH